MRRSAIVCAIYQGWPIVLVHRLLSSVGLPVVLGGELWDFARLADRVRLATPRDSSKPRVLFVIPRNFRTHATFQAGIAQALALRGAECAVVTCGGVMPVCEVAWAEQETFPRCARCIAYVQDLAKLAGLRSFNLREQVEPHVEEKVAGELAQLTLQEMAHYTWQDLPLGSYAVPSTRWRLRAHDLSKHPEGRAVLSGFIRGGAAWASGMKQVLASFRPDVLVMLNGLFLEERVTWELAKQRRCRSVLFERGRDAGTIFLTHDQSAPRYDVRATWDRIRSVPLTDGQRRATLAVVEGRIRGERLVETYWDHKESDEEKIRSRLGLELGKPMAVLFTNVVWDTAMQDRDTIFDGMWDWLRHTVELFRERLEWTLVIRIHPAETQVPGRESYERVREWVRREFGDLSVNTRLIPPEEPIDSYVLMRLARVGLVYASTAGLELALAGVPVIVAGAAHYSGKGFTADPSSSADYAGLVKRLMNGERFIPREEQIEFALRYAHLFFLRRTLPMTVVTESEEARPRLAYNSVDDLMTGRKKVLDVICDGILKASEFELSQPH